MALLHIHRLPLQPLPHHVKARSVNGRLEPQTIKHYPVATKSTTMNCHQHPSLKHRLTYPKHGTSPGFTRPTQLPLVELEQEMQHHSYRVTMVPVVRLEDVNFNPVFPRHLVEEEGLTLHRACCMAGIVVFTVGEKMVTRNRIGLKG
jgi:hypothetical protein